MTARPDDARRREQLFSALVADSYAPLLRYLRRRIPPTMPDVVAEDVLADALLVLWRRVDDLPAEQPLAWCYGVARLCLANAGRAAGRRHRLLVRLRQQPAPSADGLDSATSAADSPVAQSLRQLSLTDQEVLRLWAWEHLEPRDIAVVLGITPNAASVRLHRATQRLRHRLAADTERRSAFGPATGKTTAAPGHQKGRQEQEAPVDPQR